MAPMDPALQAVLPTDDGLDDDSLPPAAPAYTEALEQAVASNDYQHLPLAAWPVHNTCPEPAHPRPTRLITGTVQWDVGGLA